MESDELVLELRNLLAAYGKAQPHLRQPQHFHLGLQGVTKSTTGESAPPRLIDSTCYCFCSDQTSELRISACGQRFERLPFGLCPIDLPYLLGLPLFHVYLAFFLGRDSFRALVFLSTSGLGCRINLNSLSRSRHRLPSFSCQSQRNPVLTRDSPATIPAACGSTLFFVARRNFPAGSWFLNSTHNTSLDIDIAHTIYMQHGSSDWTSRGRRQCSGTRQYKRRWHSEAQHRPAH